LKRSGQAAMIISLREASLLLAMEVRRLG
jgi:hypothetical protein